VVEPSNYLISRESLAEFLQNDVHQPMDLVYWNNDLVSVREASKRARKLSGDARIARRHDLIFVA
jgi:hypothetical protein